MRKGMFGSMAVLCCGVILASGCAKEEMVKKEEPVAPPVTQAPPKAPAQAPVKEEAVVAKPVTEAPAPAAEETGQKAAAPLSALEKIFFAFDSFALSQQSRDTLYKNAEVLLKNTDKVQIEGHCDERGSDEYNLALGEKRAKAAMHYLVTLGISPDRLSTISYGKEKPVDPGHNEAAWAKNRRDEFVIVK